MVRLHGGLSHAEPGLCCLLLPGFPFPPSALGCHRSVRDSQSVQLADPVKIIWFSSHPNIDRAETQDGSFHYPFLTNDLTDG